MAIVVGRLVCDYGMVDNEPATGTVWVQPVNYATDGTLVVVPAKLPFSISEEGLLDAEVIFDNSDITPDLYLQIEERIKGVADRPAYVVKPEGEELNLATAPRYVVGPISPGPGEASTVEVGTTTTGAAGTNASVVNSGTDTAAILDFTIPRGNTGAQGIQGNPGIQGEQGLPGLDGEDGTDTNFLWQDVVTGNEVRPSADHVFWVGGTVQPVNMAVGDVWLQESP
jgi:hypothetical protein